MISQLGYAPGWGFLEFLYHPVPPAFTASKMAEHFHAVIVGTANRESPMEQRLEGIKVEMARGVEVIQLSANRNEFFVFPLFLCGHFPNTERRITSTIW